DAFDLGNRDFGDLFDFLEFGATVEIRMGYQDLQHEDPVLTGLITSVSTSFPSSGLPQVTVCGFDRSYYLMQGTRSKRWEQKDSEIAAKIADDHQLRPSTDDSQVNDQHIDQSQQSDYAFLRKLADRNGFEFYVRGNTLRFGKPRNDASATLELEWG